MSTKVFNGQALSARNAQDNANALCDDWISHQGPAVQEVSRRVMSLQQGAGSSRWYCNLELSYELE